MFGRGILLFSVAGIEVKLDWSWMLIALLIAWSLAQGYFPAISAGLPTAVYWGMGVGALVGLFASIVLHELAHSLVARRYGVPIRGITLFVFGGVAEMGEEPGRPRVEMLMAAAGPAMSLVLAAALSLAAAAAAGVGAPQAVGVVLGYLASLNLLLALFNLVPAFPLDGGRILRGAMWWATGDFRRATRWAAASGMVFSALLTALGIVSIFSGEFVQGMWWVLLGFFLSGAAEASRRDLDVREALQGVPVDRVMTADPIAVPPDTTVAELVEGFIYRHHHKSFPVAEHGRLVGCVSTREVAAVPRERWASETVAAIATPCGPEATVAPGDDAIAALTRMQRERLSRLMVVDRGRLVGVLSLSDLMRLLAVRLELAEGTARR
jgi:Zn-dependent protease/CBS domain-containing protein